MALAEEVELLKESLCNGSAGGNWQEQWEKVFSNCFLKVDSVIGGGCRGNTDASEAGPSEDSSTLVASETVGSTAVVTIICQTHIIVANCGDSRAVLCRGKVPVPLSIDHKVSRYVCSLACPFPLVTKGVLMELGLHFPIYLVCSQVEKTNMQG